MDTSKNKRLSTVRPLINTQHSLGHDVIDNEHALIGDYWLKTVNCGRLEMPLHLARLKKAMARHFEHEAELMSATGRGLCLRHRAEHGSLLDMCARAAALYEQDWRKTRALLRNEFARKLREHIVSMDLCTVLILNTAGDAPCDTAAP